MGADILVPAWFGPEQYSQMLLYSEVIIKNDIEVLLHTTCCQLGHKGIWLDMGNLLFCYESDENHRSRVAASCVPSTLSFLFFRILI